MNAIRFPYQEVAAAMLAMLESLFPEDWYAQETARFDRLRRRLPPDEHHRHFHPAWQRMELLRAARERAVPDLADVDGLLNLAETMLDGNDLIEACGGALRDLRPGNLANYGDGRVQQRIRGAVRNPAQFLDVGAEFARAAFHVKLGHRVEATEDAGAADLLVWMPGVPQTVAVECKRVDVHTGSDRYPELVKNANRQVKTRDPSAIGVLVIDVTSKARVFVPHFSAMPRRRSHVPVDVSEAVDALAPALSSHMNRSVAAVTLVWNEIRSRPERTRVVLSIERRTRLLLHRHPRHPAPDDLIGLLERGAGALQMRLTPFDGTTPDQQFREIVRRRGVSTW